MKPIYKKLAIGAGLAGLLAFLFLGTKKKQSVKEYILSTQWKYDYDGQPANKFIGDVSEDGVFTLKNFSGDNTYRGTLQDANTILVQNSKGTKYTFSKVA